MIVATQIAAGNVAPILPYLATMTGSLQCGQIAATLEPQDHSRSVAPGPGPDPMVPDLTRRNS